MRGSFYIGRCNRMVPMAMQRKDAGMDATTQREQIREKLKGRFRTAIEKALAPDPDKAPPTAEELRSAGLNARKETPRSSHATWTPAADRPDPVELLRSQGESRVQELLPVRYERMSVSAFTFYRGAALIMASDLSTTPSMGINVQACGDAHLSNFGLFLSPERRTVFDINDFDETSIGPWEWDVKRLATSVEICGRYRGFKKKARKEAVLACVQGYREAMQEFATMGEMDVWYAHADIDDILKKFPSEEELDKKDAKGVKKAKKAIEKSKAKDSSRAITKLTEVVDGQIRIVSNPPYIIPLRDMAERAGKADFLESTDMSKLISLALAEYRRTLAPDRRKLVERYHGIDMGQKVVGVGSVGTRALIVVMEGILPDDHLVLQIKEAQESVLERFCGKSATIEHGKRVVEGQRAMQTASDILLGWCRLPAQGGGFKDYYVRQLWDGKGSFDLERMPKKQLEMYAKTCGRTLAHAHARTGDRIGIASYLGKSDKFDRAIAEFAAAYADQNEADYQRFMAAIEAGELPITQSE